MEEIKESEHKNYLPSYPFSFEKIIESYNILFIILDKIIIYLF